MNDSHVSGEARVPAALAVGAGVTAALALWWLGRGGPGGAGVPGDLQQRNLALEHIVQLREQELRERNGDLRAVAGTVAHDLRNSLNTLGLNVHLLRTALNHGDGDTGTVALEHVERAREQMIDLLDRLRKLSRATFSELEPVNLDMSALARTVGGEVVARESSPHVRLDVGDLPRCRADPALAHMVLCSLIENAVQHAGVAGVERLVEVGYQPGTSPPVYFVRDNGDGLDPDEAIELFEPFRRRSAGGRPGIGLAVAARAVSRQGGWLWADSGKWGTTFYFHFGGAVA